MPIRSIRCVFQAVFEEKKNVAHAGRVQTALIAWLLILTLHGASGTSGVLFAPGVLGANDRVHAHGRPV